MCIAAGIISELFAWVSFHVLTITYLCMSPFHAFGSRYGKEGSNTPILLIHGFENNPGVFWPLIARLRKHGVTNVHVVTLMPFWGSIHDFARQIGAAVERILAESGQDRIDIVAHSMGGLAAACYLKALGGKARVRKFVAIATPFHGTPVGYLGLNRNAFEMTPRSRFLTELAFDPGDVLPVQVYSLMGGLDEYLIPHSTTVLGKPGETTEFKHAGHGMLLFSGHVARRILQILAV